MATIQDIYRALEQADAAGDVESAKALAKYIREQIGYTEPEKEEEPERTFGGYAKEALKGLVPGAVGLGETAITGAAALLPEEAEQAVRRPVEEFAAGVREKFAPAPGYEDTTVRKLSEAVGSTLPFLSLGALGAAGRIAATGLGVSAEAGESRQRAEQEGATEGERAVATVLGAPVGALEALPPIRILRRFGFADEAIEEVAGLVPTLRRVAQAGGEEALQEASSQVLQNLIAKGVYKPEEEIFGGVGEAAALGGGAGAVVGAIADLALGRRLRGRRGEEEAAPAEEAPPAAPEAAAPTKELEEGPLSPEAAKAITTRIDELYADKDKADRERLAAELRFNAMQDQRLRTALEREEQDVADKDDEEYLRQFDEAVQAREAARRRPLGEEDQMGLPLEGGFAQRDLFTPTEPGEAIPGIYRPAEEALAGLKPRSRAYKEEAKDLGLRLDKKGNLKPNQFVPEITAQVSPDQERFEFESQQQLPLTRPAGFEGQGDLFAEEPIPPGPTVPFTRQEPTVEAPTIEVPKEQMALDLPGIPMERLAPRDRVLRAMAISEDRKTVDNLKFATMLPRAELREVLGTLKNEGAIAYKPGKFEWELTPEGAERVRTGTETKPPSRRRGPALSVPPQGAAESGTPPTGERGVAGAGDVTSRVDAGEAAGEPALTEKPPMTLRKQVMMLGREVDEDRRTTFNTRAIEAYENDQIDERTYGLVRDELKNPVPNFARVKSMLEGTAKPKRMGPKFQRKAPVPQVPRVQYKAEGPSYEQGLRFYYDGLYYDLSAASGMFARPLLVVTDKSGERIGDHYANNEKKQVDARVGDAKQIGQYNLPPDIANAINDYLFSYSKGDAGVATAGKQVADVVNAEMAKYETEPKTQRGKAGAGLPIERVQAVANDAIRTWTNAPKVVIASSVNDPVIPENIRGKIPEDAPGFYVNETTYVLADRAKDEAAVRGTVFHESLGHYGLEQEFQGGLQDVMQGIYDTNSKMREAADARMKKFDLDVPTAVEEVLAERSEAGPIKESWLRGAYNQVAAYIRNFMRKRGLVSTYSDNDVNQILRQAHRRVTKLKKTSYDPFNPAIRYQRSPEEQRKGDQNFVNSVGKIPTGFPAATQATYDAAVGAASNLPSATRRALYSILNPHELDRMYRKKAKTEALANYWKDLNAEGVALRKAQDTIMDNMTRWQKVMSKYTPAEQKRINRLFMDTTVTKQIIKTKNKKGKEVEKEIIGVEVLNVTDPSRNVDWKPDVNHPLYAQFKALKPDVQNLYKELRLAYIDYQQGIEKQLQQYLTPNEWQKILSKLNERRIRVYLPLFRQGDYKLRYTDKDGETVAEQFENSAQRARAWREAKADGANPNSVEMSRIGDKTRESLPSTGFFGEVVASLKKAKVNDETIYPIIEAYLDYLPANSILQRGRRREGYGGYIIDPLQAYSNVADNFARRVINMEYAPKFKKHQQQLLIDTATAIQNGTLDPEVAEDINWAMNLHMEYVQDPNLNNWASKLGYFSYAMYLGANISTAIVNTLDIPTVTLSRLGGRHGFSKASSALYTAGKLFFSSKKTPEMQQLIDRGMEMGSLREHQLRDIEEFKNLDSKYMRVKAGVERILNWAFAKSDMFNRQTALIAAYNLNKRTPEGKFDENAFEQAQRAVYDIYGSSFPKAGPPIMRNGVAKTALTFKRFAITRMHLLGNAFYEAAKDESPEVRNMARKELAGHFGTAFVFAGAQGMPLVGAGAALLSLLNGIFGDDDEPYNPDFALREAIGLLAYKGPVNYYFGVDIASRTGWTGMFWREDPKRMAEVGPVTYVIEQFLGPAYSYAVGVPRAFDYFGDEQYMRAFEQLAPRAAGNVVKAYRYATEGAYTAKGLPLVADTSRYNEFMQIFGFRPSEIVEAGDIAGATKRMESKILERRNAIINRAAVAQMSGDAEGFQEALDEARAFSSKYPGRGITFDTLYGAIQRRQKRIIESVNGVTLDPKLAQSIYGELGIEEGAP